MPANSESKEVTKPKRPETMLTFDQYKAKYSPEESKAPTNDDPDQVAADLATETMSILRKGLGEDN